jgi:hypothetical protein
MKNVFRLMSEQKVYRRGFKLLKGYSELSLASQILGIISLILIFPMLFAIFTQLGREPWSSLPEHGLRQHFMNFVWLLVVEVLLGLASIILSLIAIYGRLVPAGETLAKWRSTFSSSAKLMKYGYWGFLGLIILAIIIFVAGIAPHFGNLHGLISSSRSETNGIIISLIFSFLGAALVAIVASIAYLVGWIGEIMFLFELSTQTSLQGFRTAGILYLLAFLVSFVSLVPHLILVISFVAPALQIAALIIIRENAIKALKEVSQAPATNAPPASQ